MKRLLAALLVACAAAPVAAGNLAATEILRQCDDATAAEVRWLLVAQGFNPGPVGYGAELTREGIAFERLLRSKDPALFVRLARSENPAAACYGIAGLVELAPAELVALAPELAFNTTEIRHQSGCIACDSSVSAELLQAVERCKLAPAQWTGLAEAWQAFLLDLEARGARREDRTAVHTVKELAGELPKAAKAPGAAVYARALLTEDPAFTLRIVAQTSQEEAARKLAIQWLAALPAPDEEQQTVNHIKARKTTGDDELNLAVAAERWERLWQNPKGLDCWGLAGWYSSAWLALGQADWQWLATQRLLRGPAARLLANPLVTWRADAPLPTDPLLRRHAVLFRLAAASEDNDAALAAAIAEDVCAFPLEANWDRHTPVLDVLIRTLGLERLLGPAMTAAASPVQEVRLAGLELLLALEQEFDEEYVAAAKAAEAMPALRQGLLRFCRETKIVHWRQLGLTWQLVCSHEAWDAPAVQELKLLAARAASRLARELANDPRMLPPEVCWAIDAMEASEQPAGELLAELYGGRDHFEINDVLNETDDADATCEVAWRRFRAAVAALPAD